MAFNPDQYLQKKTAAGGFDPDAYLSKVAPQGPGYLESARRGAAQGLSLGYSDEAVGATQAVRDYVLGRGSVMDEGIGDIYRRNRDMERAQNLEAKQANPKTYGGAQLAGAIAPSVLATVGTKGAALPAVAARLGALGAVEGLGHTEADLTQGDFKGAGIDTAIGGAVGAALPPALMGLGKAAGAVTRPVVDLGKKAFEGAGKRFLSAATNVPVESLEAYIERPGAIRAALDRTPTTLAEKELTTSTKILSDRTSKLYDEAIKTLNGKKPVMAIDELNGMATRIQESLKTKGVLVGKPNEAAYASIGRLKNTFEKFIPTKKTMVPTKGSGEVDLWTGQPIPGQELKMVPQPGKKVLTEKDMKGVLDDVRKEIKKWKVAPGGADSPAVLKLKELQGQLNAKLGASNPTFAAKMKPVAEHMDLLKRVEKKFGLEKFGPKEDRTFKAGKTAVGQLEQVPKEKNIEAREMLEDLRGKTGIREAGDPLVENAAKFKTAEDFIGSQGKPVYHHSVDKVDSFGDVKTGTYFTDNPQGYARRSNAKFANKAIIDVDGLKLANKKQAIDAGLFRGDPDKYVDNLKKQGFDGVKQTVDGDTHYLIFDSKNIKTEAQLADAFNKAGAAQPGTDILALAEDLRLASPLKTGRVQGSRAVNQYAITGAGVGTLAAGIPGGAVGGIIGAGLGAHVDKFGGEYARRIIDAFRNYQKGNVLSLLEAAPQAFGKWAPLLSQAAARGGNSLITTHFVLQQQDPEYRKQLDNINKELQGRTR